MAFSTISIISPLCLLIFLSTTTITTSSHVPDISAGARLAHLHFWFHEIRTGPNLTRLNVVQTNRTNGFGGINVFDNLMTTGTEVDSDLVGRCQGIGARTSLDGSRGWTSINFIVNKGRFSGNTFTIVGSFVSTGNVTERIVVGGTGLFRFCKGFALNYQVFTTSYGVKTEFDVYIWYYPNQYLVLNLVDVDEADF